MNFFMAALDLPAGFSYKIVSRVGDQMNTMAFMYLAQQMAWLLSEGPS